MVFGKGNAVGPGVKGVVIGNGQVLESDGMVVPNLTVTNSINGAPVVNYKKYCATISQTGTNDPVVTVLENTIGEIVWTRLAQGDYAGTLTGAFTSDKTLVLNNVTNTGRCNAQRNSINSIRVQTFNSAGALFDNFLDQNTIEIRIYE